jgi:FkbM family methyltransferase
MRRIPTTTKGIEMKLLFDSGGTTREIECFDNWLSRVACAEVVEGRSYVHFDFVANVKVVMDIGANVGAATVYFSVLYPEAKIFSFEPAKAPYELLVGNTRDLDNVCTYNFGLFSSNEEEVPLYSGALDSGTASIGSSDMTAAESEAVTLRSVTDWLAENSIARIDVLKIDTEGCEVPIMRALRDLIPSIKVIYLEYHSEDDRREIDRMLEGSHALVSGRIAIVHRGELTYLAKDAFPSEAEYAKHAISLDF